MHNAAVFGAVFAESVTEIGIMRLHTVYLQMVQLQGLQDIFNVHVENTNSGKRALHAWTDIHHYILMTR